MRSEVEQIEVSHREIYDRLVALEAKVDRINDGTADVVRAFEAAQGAFAALEFLAKMAKPLMWIGALCTAIGIAWQNFRSH